MKFLEGGENPKLDVEMQFIFLMYIEWNECHLNLSETSRKRQVEMHSCVLMFEHLHFIGNAGKVNNAFGGRTLRSGSNVYRGFPIDLQDLPFQSNGSGKEVIGVVQWS